MSADCWNPIIRKKYEVVDKADVVAAFRCWALLLLVVCLLFVVVG